MVSIHRYSSVSFHHIFRLHKNFLHPSSKPNSWPHFPKATKPSNSTEHSSIQKGGVQCTVGAGNIGCLLSANGYGACFNAPKRNPYIHVPPYAIYNYLGFLKLVIKPVAVLLEDQRSKASCERNIERASLFFELVNHFFNGDILGSLYLTLLASPVSPSVFI